jgi:ubiquinone/menaquinone biosynthesis C-methylase UbiE
LRWLNRFIDPKYVLVGTKSNRSKNKNFQEELADWERNTPFYAQEITYPFHQILSQEKMKIYKPIEQNCHILDLGAGVGYISNLLQRKGHRVVAIDFSLAMAKIAKQKYPDITYIVASADELPLKNAKFGMVIADGIFHHLKAQGIFSRSLEEIDRVLEKGDYLCFFDRHGSLSSIFLHRLIMLLKKFVELFKGHFPASSSSHELPFVEADLNKILENNFCVVDRKFVLSFPFFLLKVSSNTIQYIFGRALAIRFEKAFVPFAKFFEKTIKIKWLTMEQCCKLRKER